MPSKFVYWTSDGGGVRGGEIASTLSSWIRTYGSPSLIIYGGDVYEDGKPAEYECFQQQVGDLSLMCALAGNHDWETNQTTPETGTIPTGYESFWMQHQPPASRQPIDTTKEGGARYEHSILLNGWRLIFIDTGPLQEDFGWPFNDRMRLKWLREQLSFEPGRSKIVCSHHSRLSRGENGDQPSLQTLWETLFDWDNRPVIAFTLAGHDHNVAIYRNRGKSDLVVQCPVPDRGIDIVVNGTGGAEHYELGIPISQGTMPDAGDDKNYVVTQIELIDECRAKVRMFSFGNDPTSSTIPEEIAALTLAYDFSR